MATNVLVTGLPGDSQFSKLVYSFKNIFKRVQIKKFWIRELADMYGSDCKQMTVEFPSSQEAYKARSYLDNLSYTQGPAEYRLMASIEDDGYPEPREEQWGRSRRGKRARAVSRSPSPGYRREASKLDLEIELLRKQRQVIEEERRLLLERKKLEMIREYGPSVTRDFDDFEPPRKRRHPPAMEVNAPRRRSPPARKPLPKNAPNGLPAFFQPCKRLIGEMRELINKDTTTEERDILVKLIRAAIRKNLVIALDGKGYMPTVEILTLYRQLHPKSTDEGFVGKILANIRASYLPNELEGKKAGTGSKSKGNKQSESSEAAKDLNVDVKDEIETEVPKVEHNSEDKQVENETAPEENPAVEENGTGAAVEVKSEPDAAELNTEVEVEEAADADPAADDTDPAADDTDPTADDADPAAGDADPTADDADPAADDAFIAEQVEGTDGFLDNGEEEAAAEEQ